MRLCQAVFLLFCLRLTRVADLNTSATRVHFSYFNLYLVYLLFVWLESTLLMDPVVAVGLATNVAQLVEIAWKIVSKSHEIYKHGGLPEHRDAETITIDLQGINDKLLGYLHKAEKEKDVDEDDEALRLLCESSNKIANELIQRLNSLKVGDEYRNWKSIRNALKAVWIKSELDETAARLQGYRTQLNTRILVSTRLKLDRLDTNTQNIVNSLSDTRVLFNTNQEIQTHYLTELIIAEHEKTRERFASLGLNAPGTPVSYTGIQTMRQQITKQDPKAILLQAVSQRSMPQLRRVLREEPSSVFAYDEIGRTALHIAAEMGNEDMVGYLIRMSARINPDDDFGKLPLHYAVQSGSETTVRALVEKGGDAQAKDGDGRSSLDLCTPGTLMWWILTHGARLDAKNDDGWAALSYFTREGNVNAVRWLLDRGANTETIGPGNTTALQWAAEKGHDGMVQLLLERKANVHHRDGRDTTPLIRAGWHGKTRAGELLLDYGAEIDAVNQHDFTAFDETIHHNRTAMALMLIHRGANLNRFTADSYTSLHIAAQTGQVSIVKAMLSHGSQVNLQKSPTDDTPLTKACWHGRLEVIKVLLEHGATLETATGEDQRTALLRATECGHVHIVDYLVNHTKADIEARDKTSYTALCLAAQRSHHEIVQVLLKAGANTEAMNSGSWTPLSESSCRDLATTKLLLEHGANPNGTPNNEGWTPLHSATHRGLTDITKLLLEHGADPNINNDEDEGGYSPLNYAAQNKHISTVKTLLQDPRTDIDLTNRDGWSSLAEACHHGSLEIVELLISHGANKYARDNLRYTPLTRAAQAGYYPIVCKLLDKRNIDEENRAGWTSLMEASWHGFPEIVKLLLEKGAKSELANDQGNTALMLARQRGHKVIVGMLTA